MLTYRELIRDLNAMAALHGDHVLDLPATASLVVPIHITEVTYCGPEPEDVEQGYAAEPESLVMVTNED